MEALTNVLMSVVQTADPHLIIFILVLFGVGWLISGTAKLLGEVNDLFK